MPPKDPNRTSDTPKSPGGPAIWSASPDAVRELFLRFFEGKGHRRLPSASLVPENDPSLLFIGAGMAPFKDQFLGRVPLTFRRATTSQKCLRTGDLEAVGRTPGHHTFFEMLGNFSFGDYFKDDAIAWAWEFLTSPDWLAIPRERLRVSVYEKDDEAAAIWTRVAGIPAEEIARLGAKSNFWPANAPEAGPDGPCGPCSEIFFDLGFKPDPSVKCSVEGCIGSGGSSPASVDCDCRRLLEIWNLVFQQFDRKGRNNLVPLAMRNIDTGMGFERLLTVLAHLAEGKPFGQPALVSNFDTPLFAPFVRHGMSRSLDVPAGRVVLSVPARRVADHARAAVFCVADGVRPSNEGRGYVLRRVIRRAVRDLFLLGHDREPYLHTYVPVIASGMKGGYPEIEGGAREIAAVLRAEEERFRETYLAGEQILSRRIAALQDAGRKEFPAEALFELYDTYGFPADLATDVIREEMLEPDLEGFERLMEQRRKQSREGSKIAGDIFAAGPLERVKKQGAATRFLGYGPEPEGKDGAYTWDPGVEGSSTVAEILVAEKPSDGIAEGQEGALVLEATPFYAEQGGQVGDTGEIRGPDGALFRVKDTQKVEGFHLHLGRMEKGSLSVGAAVSAVVDRERRDAIRRNHTGTHLLHRVLKVVLGEDARQAGSLVAPDRLRFDFTWPRALTPQERERVEAEVNRRIRENHPLVTRVYDPAAAKATGAVSMFGEKYGDRIRVLTAGDSKEFCGGTHCHATGDIEEFRVVAEKSIGSGVRRIEAVTGRTAVQALEAERARAAEEERRRQEERKARKSAARPLDTGAVDLLASPRKKAGPVEFVVVEGENVPDGALMGAGDSVKAADGAPLVALVCSRNGEDVVLVAAGNAAAVKGGFKAGEAVGAAAKALGGGGGGRPDLARGKGRDPARLPEAVAAFEEYLKRL